MKRFIIILMALLLSGCVIHKSVHITIKDSSNIGVDSAIYGSDLEDISPELDFPLIP